MFPMCIKSVFESINSMRHNDIVRKAVPHVYDRITVLKKFFRRSYLRLFTSNLLLLHLVKYSPVTFIGKARAISPPVDHISLLRGLCVFGGRGLCVFDGLFVDM